MEEIRKYPVGMQTLLICHLDDDKHPAEDFDAACKGIQECLLTLEAMGKFYHYDVYRIVLKSNGNAAMVKTSYCFVTLKK